MDPLRKRAVGAATGVTVTQLGCGGSQLGSMFEVVRDEVARETLAAAWDGGIRYFDTAPFYGRGLSEQRFGAFLRERPRDEFVLSTKVGRVLFPVAGPVEGPGTVGALPNGFRFDYSYDGVMRSHEDSLRRLGLDRVDVLLIHDLDAVMHQDPEAFAFHLAQLEGGGFRALDELRSAGTIRAVGAGLNEAGHVRRLLRAFDMDVFLLALCFTLLDQQALDDDLPACEEHGASVVIGAPFSSGILAADHPSHTTHRYQPADAAVTERTQQIRATCQQHGITIRAAALQFPFTHPSVVSTIPGMRTPDQVHDNLTQFRTHIPPSYWQGV